MLIGEPKDNFEDYDGEENISEYQGEKKIIIDVKGTFRNDTWQIVITEEYLDSSVLQQELLETFSDLPETKDDVFVPSLVCDPEQ